MAGWLPAAASSAIAACCKACAAANCRRSLTITCSTSASWRRRARVRAAKSRCARNSSNRTVWLANSFSSRVSSAVRASSRSCAASLRASDSSGDSPGIGAASTCDAIWSRVVRSSLIRCLAAAGLSSSALSWLSISERRASAPAISVALPDSRRSISSTGESSVMSRLSAVGGCPIGSSSRRRSALVSAGAVSRALA